MARRERIAAVDTAWLRMDRPTNLMMITGVLVFAAPVSYERLCQVVNDRMAVRQRFRQRVIREADTAYWEEDPWFHVTRHVHRVALPGGADRAGLQAYAGELQSTAPDPLRPLWHFHLVEDYNGGSALVIRMHHCYADGLALVRVLLALTDLAPDGPPAMSRETAGKSDAWMPGWLRFGMRWSRGAAEEAWALARSPMRVLGYARTGMKFASEVTRLTTLSDDPPTHLRGEPGVEKRLAWAEPLPLSEARTLAHVMHCSINDVLLAAVTGALRSYLLQRGDQLEGLGIRAVVPVNLRSEDSQGELGNHFGLVFLELPVGTAHPLERLFELRRRMRDLRSSVEPVFSYGLLQAAGMSPTLVQEEIVDLLSRKASMVITNVPGPRQALYMAGAEIREILFWVPQSGDIGLGISILSYNERVYFGLAADTRLVPDPDDVVRRFRREFEELVTCTLLTADWERRGV
ncbi:MAG: wax ester/triacylglycerol synthase family O-acyltransferase [Ectothiorhodospiraceae bacterium]|jgi:WS/DGAT/MGAT family acyltransferase